MSLKILNVYSNEFVIPIIRNVMCYFGDFDCVGIINYMLDTYKYVNTKHCLFKLTYKLINIEHHNNGTVNLVKELFNIRVDFI